MSRAAILIVPLIVTLAAIAEAVVVTDRRATETHVWQPSKKEEERTGGAAESRENEVLNKNKSEVHFPLVDQAYAKPPSTVADATSGGSTSRRVVVGQSVSSSGTALSNSGSVAPRGTPIGAANGNDSAAVGTELSRSECAVSNGTAGGGATGRLVTGNGTAVGGNAVATGINVTAVGGNATAACFAFGGDAVVIISSSDVSSLINNSSGGDFWALLRTLVSQFNANVVPGRRGGNAAARGRKLDGSAVGHAGCGSRAVGGSAVFRAGHGGRAVGGSATILGVVGGKLQVLRHAAGEISNVSGRIASGGVVTFP